jgi:hypothetical protein
MRMAMSCLAWGDLARPTRRARLSSASVDSGMSEKSIPASGIGLALFAARLARADDADRFFAIVFAILHSPNCVHQQEHAAGGRFSEALRARLGSGMFRVLPVECFWVGEDRRRLFERDAVLAKIAERLRGVPREHIYVYTLINGRWQGPRSFNSSCAGRCTKHKAVPHAAVPDSTNHFHLVHTLGESEFDLACSIE